MSWAILKSQHDWTAYREKAAVASQVAEDRIDWGKGPKTYPCLADSARVAMPPTNRVKMLMVFVYPEDAKELLHSTVPPTSGLETGAYGSGTQTTPNDQPGAARQTQADFNRWQAAVTLTVAWFLTETGICTSERYEEKLAEFLHLVDDITAGKAGTLDPGTQNIIDRYRALQD